MASSPILIHDENALRAQIWEWRGAGETISFVPTMGALHAGHLSLITLAKTKASKVVASIFVNPTQFAEGEDLDSYPRTIDDDVAKLKSTGCDLVYIPSAASMYYGDHSTTITIGGPALRLETDYRPHFFGGVSLVVTKLLNRVQPDIAIFGEKDYQQLLTIKRMVRDLDIPTQIIGAPIAREEDGLAMSSRNRYFDNEGRAIAGTLNVMMRDCARAIRDGGNIENICARTIEDLLAQGFAAVDYVKVADTETLEYLTGALADHPARLLIAAHCKGVRLIDNCAV